MTRTPRLTLHLLFLAGLVLAACGPKATPEPTPTLPLPETPTPAPTPTPTAPPEPATISLWHTWEGEALEQALLNIMINAVEAMPRGGQLRINTGQEDDSIFIAVT
ncbi:MAG: hypothetical protein ACP5UM_13705, partial [Anaerolineae bacterium]